MAWPRLWPWRKTSELERLRQSEARYRLIADSAGDVIIQYDLDGRVLYASPSIVRLGYRPEDVVGRRTSEFFHVDEAEARESRMAALRRGVPLPSGSENERRIRHGDGSWIWIQGNPTVIRDADGEPTGVVSIIRDVTERRALEDELRAKREESERAMVGLRDSETRYRMLADHIADVIFHYDLQATIRYVSPSIGQFGYAPEELVGRSVLEFLDPEMMEDHLRFGRAIASGREPLPSGSDHLFRFRCKSGDWVWFEGNPALLRDADGQVMGAITMARDVSARRALEDELRRRQHEAEAASVAKSEFLANMSHEIRTPLTAVVGFAGLLGQMDGLPERARIYAERIGKSGDALTAIVDNVLDFSKVEAGQVELRPRPAVVREVVEDALSLVADAAAAKRLALGWTADGPLPDELVIDPSRLRQVLLNLLTNAVKFTPAGQVWLTASYASGRLSIAVSDTGVGVPADLSDRLFQRFSQIDGSSARRFGGTGLGLAISKGLVELMGGEIGFSSAAGDGSTFRFSVPAEAAPPTAAAPRLLATPPPAGPARVLVVDDAPLNRELIRALLSPFELEIAEAGDGAEALAATEAAAFDLVLMDLQMPGMDGIAATRAIRAGSELNRATPIVAVSASVQPSDVEACREAGMNDHVPKPISASDLLSKVARWTAADRRAA